MNWAAVIAPRAPAGVLHVSDLRVDQLVVLAAERHAPHALAGVEARLRRPLGELVVVGEQAGMLLAERDDDAPVKVARSTMNFGLKRVLTYYITSASTSRPSASVFITSMVWPDIEVTTSPGRWALPSKHVLDEAGRRRR